MSGELLAERNPAEEALTAAFDSQGASGARAEAWARFAQLGLPHRRVEAWKWTDLRGRIGAEAAGAARAAPLEASRPADAVVTLDRAPTTAMPALAGAMAEGCAVYVLADGETLDLTSPSEGGHDILVVRAPAGARCRVVERYPLAGAALSNIALLFAVETGAELERIVLAPDAAAAVLVNTAAADVAEGAVFRQSTLAFGAALSRLETHVTVQGSDAQVSLNGVSLLAENRHADQTTVVTHAAPGAVTRETFRTVATDAASGVFQGKIKVERPAQKTDAEMSHAALLLSETAAVNAKPELEIYADDVQCAHGNAIGAIDENALFYLRQRGLPEARARALLTRAFLEEALAEIGAAPLRERLLEDINAWMKTHL